MELKQWIIEYVKARNAMLGTLKETHDNGDEITFVHNNKTQHYLVSPKLIVPTVKDWYVVCCLNTEENLQLLIDHWSDFLQDKLTIQFVNPNENVFWKINPKLHSAVADPEKLEEGLRGLFQEVTPV